VGAAVIFDCLGCGRALQASETTIVCLNCMIAYVNPTNLPELGGCLVAMDMTGKRFIGIVEVRDEAAGLLPQVPPDQAGQGDQR
jgi:hypothetical protein